MTTQFLQAQLSPGSAPQQQLNEIAARPDQGILGNVGSFIFGPSPATRQAQRNQELLAQFGGQVQGDFLAPGLAGLRDQRGALANQLGSFQGPQLGQSGFRGEQGFLLDQLRGDVLGQGPGVELARRQAMQAGGAAGQQQLGFLASQRGNPLAARQAAVNLGNIGGTAGQQAQTGALQAMLAARGQFGNVAGQARGQDLQRGIAQGQFDLSAQDLSQRGQLSALQQQLELARMQQQGAQAFQGNQLGQFGLFMGQPQLPTSRDQMLGLLTGGAEMLAGLPPGTSGAVTGGGNPMQQFSRQANTGGNIANAAGLIQSGLV